MTVGADGTLLLDRLLTVAVCRLAQPEGGAHDADPLARLTLDPAAFGLGLGSDPDLELALRVLGALAGGRRDAALEDLSGLLDAPLMASGLGTRLEELGAGLATATGDDALASRFLERRAAYRLRHGAAEAVAVLAAVAAEPSWLDDLDAMLGDAEGRDAAQPSVPGPPSRPDAPADLAALVAGIAARPPYGSGFVPLAREPGEPDGVTGGAADGEAGDAGSRDGAMAYLVTLHHLEDARTADFSAHRIGWDELDSELDGVSDLVLSFEAGSRSLLRQVDPESMSLRLFFGDGPGYDEVSTAAGTLYDVEVNPAELRIYLKLRRPVAWTATGLSPTELWRHLRSCVLITEPG